MSGLPPPLETRIVAGTGSPCMWAARVSFAAAGVAVNVPFKKRALGMERAPPRMPSVRPVGGVGRLFRRDCHAVSSSTRNVIPALVSRSISASPIATAVVTWPAVSGSSSCARQSADSASIFDVSP